jgi:cell division protein FtsB
MEKSMKKYTKSLVAFLLAFVLMATMCGRDIIRLKAENAELKKQQVALEKKRDELKEELKNTGENEYIREQARKQLRLLNPGEILFTFDD